MTDQLIIEGSDFAFFTDRALVGMAAILRQLGDELANTRPAPPGANTPYALVTHCLGVVEYWGGHVVAGRPSDRDRDAEFTASGSVTGLLARIESARNQLRRDVAGAEPSGPLAHPPDSWADGPDIPLDPSTALMHLYEELAQHHGQLEITRDALLTATRDQPTIPDQPRTAMSPAAGAFEPTERWLRSRRGVKWARPGSELLPAWVADMDFAVCPAVRAAIEAELDRGDLGYPDWPGHPLAEPFAVRMADRYGWNPDPAHVRGVTDLIQALQITIELMTEPGDSVALQTPNYPPFLATVPTMGRRSVALPLIPDEQGSTWRFDPGRLESDLRESRARLLLLVNPHNPSGHVFSRTELSAIAEVVERLGLLVVSDEIHAELTYRPAAHVPFASLSPEIAARTVTISSASKAFNLAGLRTAVAHVGPAELRRRWDATAPDLFGATNTLGVAATAAAWRDGDDWLGRLVAQLQHRRDRVDEWVARTPGVHWIPPQATYLGWLRFDGLGDDPAAALRDRARVELSSGPDFGPSGRGHARLNFATSTAILDTVLARVAAAL